MNGSTGSTDRFGGSSAPPEVSRISTEERAVEAFRHAPTAMLLADQSGRVLLVNSAFTDITGWVQDDVSEFAWPRLLVDDDVDRGWEAHRGALAGGGCGPNEGQVAIATGSDQRRVVIECHTLPGGSGNEAVGVIVALRTVTSDEEALRTITELRTESADTILWAVNLRTGKLSELFGPSPLGRLLASEGATMEDLLSRVHRDDVARLRDALETSSQGRDYEQQFRILDLGGDERWLWARARYLAGETPRLVGFADDVTDRVQLVERLADRRRIEAAQGRQVTELAAKLVSATTADEVTGLLAEEFVPIFGGTNALVMLVEENVFHAAPSTAPRNSFINMIDGSDVDDAMFPMGAVAQDRQPRFFESRMEALERFPAVEELLDHTSSHSWAIVPIFGDRRVALGVWQVAWDEPHHATPDERALMLTLAGLAGQALQRVNRQQAELELADAIQRRMLPPQLPELDQIDVAARYLPARAGWRVCGDFYDVIQLPERRVGLLVGDVQGHGVEAAAAMGQIRIAFRAYAANQTDPGLALAETNGLLTETGEIVFATCGYLVLDLESGEMRAAWAGQPPVLIATTEGFSIWQPETGPPVGVASNSKYPVSIRLLASNETILLCSDGLVESAVVHMDDGLQRVGRALRATATDVHAAASSLATLTPAGRGDDIALLVARMT